MYKSKKATQYMFFEMLPSFIIGVLVFIFILLMFQSARYTEFVLIHGLKLTTLFEMLGLISISFLPVLFPMSLLFAVIMTYTRLSQDSEILAMKSLGLNQLSLTVPAVLLGFMVSVISAQTSFYIAPWGNRQFEVMVGKFTNTKATSIIKEGTFSEGFFDMVVYANKVDPKTNTLSNIFIYDEKDPKSPLTIVAQEGVIIQDNDLPGHKALLRLKNGDIHSKSESHTKIQFKTYDIKLLDPVKIEDKDKTPPSLSIDEIKSFIKNPKTTKEEKNLYLIEYHKRWSISIVCTLFAFVGVGLATQTNKRSAKSGSVVLCLGVIFLFWALLISMESLAKAHKLPVEVAMWIPDIFFLSLGLYRMKKIWN